MHLSKLTGADLESFVAHLMREEKSAATIEKYRRDTKAFLAWLDGKPVTHECTLDYKQNLIQHGYTPSSINSMLASLNSLLKFLGRAECCVKYIKVQHRIYCPESKELSKAEYMRLISAAGNNARLALLLQTICSTGIRISELAYFTVEAVRRGEVTVTCKNKTRAIFISAKLKKHLLDYAKSCGISSGIIFRTRGGKPMDRSNIWRSMKKLCRYAGVSSSKVFPHNLRKLFARTFYNMSKDIAKLADILGHSSIDTTRIYIVSTGAEHRRRLELLGLVV